MTNHQNLLLSVTLLILHSLLLCSAIIDEAQNDNHPKPLVVGEGGHFKTIQAAVDAVPSAMNDHHRHLIILHPGIYTERVVIPAEKTSITLQGFGRDITIISWNATARTGSRVPGLRSSTLVVYAAGFIARSVTIQNTGKNPSWVSKRATALEVAGDRSAFYDCKIAGFDSAIYDRVGRHYFRDCVIQGSNDIIFGNGQSIYRKCEIDVRGLGSITAHSRQNAVEKSGFSFVDCRIKGEGRFFLGKAWGPYSRVFYISTFMEDVIEPAGWSDQEDPARDSTVMFGEYGCSGPGASLMGRVYWYTSLHEMEAMPFMDLTFIDGHSWLLYI